MSLGPGTIQQACGLAIDLRPAHRGPFRFLVRYRARHFAALIDAVLVEPGIKVMKSATRHPGVKCLAERLW
jgi:hypothetical protein